MLFWRFIRRLNHFVENLLKFLQAGGRNDDVVPPAVYIFSNAQKPTAGILLEGKQKRLSLDLYFVAL